MLYDWTLRDVKKFLARFPDNWKSVDHECFFLSVVVNWDGKLIYTLAEDYKDLLRKIDKAINAYGADCPIYLFSQKERKREREEREERESRPKGTDEVQPQSEDPSEDSDCHGGDGASGECEPIPEQSGDGPEPGTEGDGTGIGASRSGGDLPGSPTDPGGPRDTDTSAETDGSDCSEARECPEQSGAEAPSPGAISGGEPSGGDPTLPSQHSSASGSATSDDPPQCGDVAREDSILVDEDNRLLSARTPRHEGDKLAGSQVSGASADDQGQEAPDDASCTAQTDADDNGDGGEGKSSASVCAVYHFGGDYLSQKEVDRLASKAKGDYSNKLRKAFERLIKKLTEQGGIEESPRLDTRRFAREIVSRRYAINRARRRELSRSYVVIAVDCSGSCSACCNELYALAVTAALSPDSNIIVIEHSNGFSKDSGGLWGYPLSKNIVDRKKTIATMIALGDSDAEHEYHIIHNSGIPVYWLDSYCARDGVKKASKNTRPEDWTPKAHYQGVSGMESTIQAFKYILKETR